MKIIRQSSGVVVTRGRTLDNVANLAPTFMQTMMDRYGGTRLARQELDGEDLWDEPGALWDRDNLDGTRQARAPIDFARVVVAIDPSATNTKDSDETGIVVVAKGMDGHGYVLADLSGKYSPDGWAKRAIAAYHEWSADRIIAEKNQGGDMVAHTLKVIDPDVPLRLVHASRGKIARAEPVAALYEQGKIHHVGCFGQLEDQMCTWVQGMKSPDRLDALVWGLTELFIGKGDFCFG
jgi:phage terminase large subunit-like protein